MYLFRNRMGQYSKMEQTKRSDSWAGVLAQVAEYIGPCVQQLILKKEKVQLQVIYVDEMLILTPGVPSFVNMHSKHVDILQ
jgi:hypothetical protein